MTERKAQRQKKGYMIKVVPPCQRRARSQSNSPVPLYFGPYSYTIVIKCFARDLSTRVCPCASCSRLARPRRKWPPISPTKVDVRPWGNQHRSWGNRISATTSWGADCCMKVPLRGHDRSPIPTKGRLFICSATSWGTLIINHLPRPDMGSHDRTTR